MRRRRRRVQAPARPRVRRAPLPLLRREPRPGRGMCVDHFLPDDCVGGTDPWNLVLARRDCGREKARKLSPPECIGKLARRNAGKGAGAAGAAAAPSGPGGPPWAGAWAAVRGRQEARAPRRRVAFRRQPVDVLLGTLKGANGRPGPGSVGDTARRLARACPRRVTHWLRMHGAARALTARHCNGPALQRPGGASTRRRRPALRVTCPPGACRRPCQSPSAQLLRIAHSRHAEHGIVHVRPPPS